MLTNSLRKDVASLDQAKHRRELQAFRAEGTKCVLDTMEAFELRHLLATAQWIEEHPEVAVLHAAVLEQATMRDLERMSSLTTPAPVIAVYALPEPVESLPSEGLTVALDSVQDPGNLGTIVRLCDWMGVERILASRSTADVFSPKVVQATMGAISRVIVTYGDLPRMIERCRPRSVFGTFLDGEDIYRASLPNSGIIVMGNEGRGISPQLAKLVTRRLLIPSYPPDRPTSESLNVATATAITLAMFRRYQLQKP